MHYDHDSQSDSRTVRRETETGSLGAPLILSAPDEAVKRISSATWVGLLIATALPLVAPFLPFVGPPSDPGVHTVQVSGLTARFTVDPAALGHFVTNVERDIIFKWVRSIALILLVVLWERKPLSSIGLKRVSWQDIFVVIGAYFLVFLIGHFLDIVLPKRLPSDVQLATMLFPFPLRAAMVLTAAVTEEIESRGFLIERLETITGSPWVAAALAYLIFLLQHATSWGVARAARIALWTTGLVTVYLWRRNLFACISLHFLADATALLRASKIT
jgi:membrane protease YdiL (CAAX protease family)